jgi:glycosyltransferase involved in cell wall biosynthesis
MLNLIYTYDIFSVQQYGGISRYFSEIIRRIPPSEANVRVLAGLYINEYTKELKVSKGLKVPPIPYTGFIRKKINKLFQKVMLQGIDDETIIHQTYYYPFSFPKKAKLVVTVYDMIHERFDSSDLKTSSMKRRSCEQADVIIAISNSTKNDLVSMFGIDPKKIVVIYLASSLAESVLPTTDCIKREPYILYVGERKGYKNFGGLLQAYSESVMLKNNFHLVCFGGGFDVVEKDKLRELRIMDLVHHINGHDSLLAQFYKNAHAFVYPSLFEGFGLPPLEAMSLSCPVICSNTSSISEVAGDAAVYFDPADVSSIKNALEESLFDNSLLDELKKKGLRRASMFKWEKCVEETIGIYRFLSNR